MSDDPETVRQIRELARDTRPLLVLDVDDVLLEFITPLVSYLDDQDIELRLDTFKLHGNTFDRKTGLPLEQERVSALIDAFFHVQSDWQTGANGAAEAVATLARDVEVVLLTAMTHRHRATRRAHLDRLGLPYPLLTTDTPKGPAVSMLRGETKRPVAFVDDIPRNLLSVRDSVPDASLFNLMTAPSLRALLPPIPDGITIVDDWREAGPMIARALGV
jgi:hypothetical protein